MTYIKTNLWCTKLNIYIKSTFEYQTPNIVLRCISRHEVNITLIEASVFVFPEADEYILRHKRTELH